MKKYNDIGDLYRETFSDYAPQPPASVWEKLELATQKKPSLWKKLTLPFAGIVLVGAVVYLFTINSEPKESLTAMAQDKQENTDNQMVNNEKQNISELSEGNNTSVLRQQNQATVSPTQHREQATLAINHSSHDNTAEENQTPPAIAQNASDEQNQKQNQEQNPVKTAQNDVQQPKVLPVKISKDTTVCENTAVQLYVLNAENIRWNTGETKNRITVYPFYREQYSVTFSTKNVKDTTVYIHIDVVSCTEVYIPNIFTPNGDGRNDIFFVETDMKLKSFEMVVYSSNGQQLFLSKDINRGWDGTYKGQPQPHGLYFYTVRYIDNLGKNVEKRGELLLILQ